MAKTRWQQQIETRLKNDKAKQDAKDLGKAVATEMQRATRHISLASPLDNWGGGGGGGGGGVDTPRAEYQRRHAEQKRFWGKNGEVAKMFSKGADLWKAGLGIAIGNAVKSFVSEAQDAALAFQRLSIDEYDEDYYEKQLKLAKTEGGYRSANEWGRIGAELGSVGGVVGETIGRGIGTIGGKIWGSWRAGNEEELRQSKEKSHNTMEKNWSVLQRDIGKMRALSDWSLQEVMDRQGSRHDKIAYLDLQMRRIKSGGGEYSMKNITKRLAEMGETQYVSPEGRRLRAMLQEQQGRYDQLKLERLKLSTNPLINWQEGSQYADSYAQKGLYVGAQIDVLDVNREILGQLKMQTEIMKKGMNNPYETGIYNNTTTAILK